MYLKLLAHVLPNIVLSQNFIFLPINYFITVLMLLADQHQAYYYYNL